MKIDKMVKYLTLIYGIIFLVAYLGGAVAITFISAKEGHPYFFPIVFSVTICVAEFLINPTIKNILSLKKMIHNVISSIHR